jgi:hypothetical protein
MKKYFWRLQSASKIILLLKVLEKRLLEWFKINFLQQMYIDVTLIFLT